ncbi:unnamed protein product [Schistosoma bovis]|nr:unnamed protein product [Schistosoma intercalatum]CAH8506844.1 unnamed protein product [Schistosoma bovis]CAH8510173.1 unnamed protein product [Schistosoma haematobium]
MFYGRLKSNSLPAFECVSYLMTVYNLYIYGKNGDNLFYREWTPTKQGECPSDNDLKLMRGMLIGLKGFCQKISPLDYEINRFSYVTNTYRLHFYETPTLMKIVLTTDNSCAPMNDELEGIFQIYTKYVSQNPLIKSEGPIKSQVFSEKLDQYVQSLPVFNK